MPDQHAIEMATEYLDEMIDALEADIKAGGFDNSSALWLLKAWSKIGILVSGNGGGFHKTTAAYWLMKGTPPAAKAKRSKLLLNALEDYSQVLPSSQAAGGDFFNRANEAVRFFAWEYRQHLSGAQEKQFTHDLHEWMTLSPEQVQQKVIFKMDQ